MRCLILFWIVLTNSGLYAQSWPQINMAPASDQRTTISIPPSTNQFRDAQELEEILANTLLQLQEDLQVKGLSAAIHFGDGSEWADAVGFSSLSPSEELHSDHYFSMGSVGKTIVSAAILLLYERDSLGLDDSLGLYGLTQSNIAPEITIRQLLRHESGIFNYTSHPNFNPTIQTNSQQLISLQDILDNFVAEPLFAPGSNFAYSNTNFVLLAQIIEAITGQAFSTFIRDQLLDPLGLDAIFMPITEPWQNPVAHLWIDTNGDGIVEDFHDQFITWPALLTSTAAPGGYFSTASELARWMYAYQSGEVHSSATLAEAREFRSTTLPAGTQYGLGLSQRIFSGYEAWGIKAIYLIPHKPGISPNSTSALVSIATMDRSILGCSAPSPWLYWMLI